MKPDKVLQTLGIAAKAGFVTSGEFQTENAVRSSMADLVIIAEDASDNTKKKFRNMCEFYKVQLVIYGVKESLGHAIGKEFRASLAVTDHGLAENILGKIELANQVE